MLCANPWISRVFYPLGLREEKKHCSAGVYIRSQWHCWAIWIAVAIVGLAGWHSDAQAEPYVDPKGYFRITPPVGWTVEEYPEDPRGKVAFHGPSGNADLRVLVQGVEFDTIDRLVAQCRDRETTLGVSTNIVQTTFLGYPAVRRQFLIKGLQVYYMDVLAGNVAYNLGYSAPPAVFNAFFSLVNTSIETFQPLQSGAARPLVEAHKNARDKRLRELAPLWNAASGQYANPEPVAANTGAIATGPSLSTRDTIVMLLVPFFFSGFCGMGIFLVVRWFKYRAAATKMGAQPTLMGFFQQALAPSQSASAEQAVPGPDAGVLEVQCPRCSKILRIPEQYAGKIGRCSTCQQAMIVPGSGPPPVMPPSGIYTIKDPMPARLHQAPDAEESFAGMKSFQKAPVLTWNDIEVEPDRSAPARTGGYSGGAGCLTRLIALVVTCMIFGPFGPLVYWIFVEPFVDRSTWYSDRD